MEQEKSIFCFFEKRPKYAEQFAEQIKMKTLKALMAKGKLKICAEWVGMTLETAQTHMNTGFFARP